MSSDPAPLEVHAVIQAGGRGERLRPITDTTPKALIEVGGLPIIERILLQIKRSGIRSATVVTGWLGDRLEARIREDSALFAPMDIGFLREEEPLGNAGALAQVESARTTLFIFGDLVTDLDLGELLKKQKVGGVDMLLASHHEAYTIQYGELIVDDTRVVGYEEKPTKQFLVCSGIAVFSPAVLRLCKPGRQLGLSSLVNTAIQRGLSISHWLHGARWIDVNNQQALQHARESFSE